MASFTPTCHSWCMGLGIWFSIYIINKIIWQPSTKTAYLMAPLQNLSCVTGNGLHRQHPKWYKTDLEHNSDQKWCLDVWNIKIKLKIRYAYHFLQAVIKWNKWMRCVFQSEARRCVHLHTCISWVWVVYIAQNAPAQTSSPHVIGETFINRLATKKQL